MGGATGGTVIDAGEGPADSPSEGNETGDGAPEAEVRGDGCPKPSGQSCHTFLANDNGRNIVDYVDEFDSTKNWSSPKLGTGAYTPRSIEIVDNPQSTHEAHKAVLVSTNLGYSEIDLATGKVIKSQSTFSGVRSACRIPDGTTALGRAESIDFVRDTGEIVRSIPLPAGADLGTIRRNPADGTFWFAKGRSVYAIDAGGAVVWQADMGIGGHEHRVWWRDGGGAYASTGDPPTIVEFDAQGKIVNQLGGRTAFPFLDDIQGFVRLPSGNFVATNWLGHISNPLATTPQLVELTPDNKMVWSFGDQSFARQLTDVYVLR
jgi:hypothetical protein